MYKLEKFLNNGKVCEDLLRKEIPILSNSSLSEHAFCSSVFCLYLNSFTRLRLFLRRD